MDRLIPVSVLIPTKNEAALLPACLMSVRFCDDIVVVDSGSTDGTQEIAKNAGARVVDFKWNRLFPKKKNWALSNVRWKNEWVLIIDADERITPPLESALREALRDTRYDGYYVNRRFWFLDGWLNHCGYFPSWNLRFFRHELGRYETPIDTADTNSGDNEVHEHVELQGSAGYLDGEMAHYAFPDISTWVEKHNRYSSWEARLQLEARATEASSARVAKDVMRRRWLRRVVWSLPFRPTLRFLYHYVARAGFLDGYRGWVFCRLMGWYEFMCAAKAHEIRRVEGTQQTGSSQPHLVEPLQEGDGRE